MWMPDPRLEIEIKLIPDGAESSARLPSVLRELRVAAEAHGLKRVEDTYLDTASWDMYQSGFACRLRRTGTTAVLTLKALRPIQESLAQREELEEELPDAPLDPTQLRPRRLQSFLEERTKGKPLRVLFRLAQEREVWQVRGHGFEAELSMDRCHFHTPKGAHEEREVELELSDGAPAALRAFAARLVRLTGWRPGGASKFQRGLELAGLAPPALPGGSQPGVVP
ncbi:MAG: CYTH domain-containing protein [Planctomycetota bacterium]|nr:MAG: CYTH domain-containing protein [Planctomycetota bacterium]